MKRPERPPAKGDAVDLHQVAQGAGVLGQQQIGARQHIQRPQGDVTRGADRRCDEVQTGLQLTAPRKEIAHLVRSLPCRVAILRQSH